MYIRFPRDICVVDIIIKLFETFYSKSVEFICQLKRTISVNKMSLLLFLLTVFHLFSLQKILPVEICFFALRLSFLYFKLINWVNEFMYLSFACSYNTRNLLPSLNLITSLKDSFNELTSFKRI